MNDYEKKTIIDALTKSHAYLLKLPGRVFTPEEGCDSRDYYCFSCMASSGENHRADCEVVELSELLKKARDIAARELQTR